MAQVDTLDLTWEKPSVPQPAPIVVGTDLGHHADLAVTEAARRAQHGGATLIVVHVEPERTFAMVDAGLVGAALQGHVENLTTHAAECHLLAGSSHAELIRLAEKRRAQLVVVGATGAGRLGNALFGTTAENVVRYAHGPVLVVREAPQRSSVIVGTDFSDASEAPLLVAIEEARRSAAELVLFHSVYEHGPRLDALGKLGISASKPHDDLASRLSHAKEKLDSLLETVGVEGRGVVVDTPPAKALASLASEANASLVVVGTHGRSGLRRMALGSVAAHVVRSAPCSVLVVR